MTATPTTPPPGTGAPTAATTPADSSPPDSTTVPPAGRVYLVAAAALTPIARGEIVCSGLMITGVHAETVRRRCELTRVACAP